MPSLDELRLPSHKTEELVESVRRGDSASPAADPRDSEEYSFYFEYANKRGEVYEGRFVNRILTLEQTQQVHILKARMLQSVPVSALSEEIAATTQVLAHMSISLEHKVEWAKDLRTLRDPSVVWKLWAKVEDHESHYFRMDQDTESRS